MADWFYAQGTTQHGPVALNFLIESLRSGALNANDLVWRDGLAQWTPAGQVPELAGALGSAPPPPPPPRPTAAYASPAMAPGMSPAFGQPYYPPAASQHSSMATTSMVLGILGICCFGFLAAIPALICGIIALNGMKRTGDARGRGMAIAGVVLGSVSLALSVVFFVVFVALGARHATPMPIAPYPPRQWNSP